MSHLRRASVRRAVPALIACLMLSALSVLQVLPAGAAGSVVFDSDFEEGNSDGFGTYPAAGGSITYGAAPDRQGKVAVISTDGAGQSYLGRYRSLAGTVALTASVRVSDTTHTYDVLWAHGSIGGTTRYASFLQFAAGGAVKALGATTGLAFEADRWYDLRVVIDHGTGRADAYVDGAQVLDDRPILSNATWSSTGSVRLGAIGTAGTTSRMYVDDVIAVQEARELPDAVGGWNARSYSDSAPAFAADGTRLTIDADAGEIGSLWRDYPAVAGATYIMRSTAQVSNRGSGTELRMNVVPLVDGAPLMVAGREVSFTRLYARGHNEPDPAVQLAVRVPESSDGLRVEVVATGPGRAEFESPAPAIGASAADLGRHPASSASHVPVRHPQNMMGWGQWTTVANEPAETKQAKVAPLLAMSTDQLAEAARAAGAVRASLSTKPDIMIDARRLAHLYVATGERRYSDAARTIMEQLALTYPTVPFKDDGFFGPSQAPEGEMFYAYDAIHDAPGWTAESRAIIEDWFRQNAADVANLYGETETNIVPYGLRQMFGLAAVLDDPDLLRLFIPLMDRTITGRQLTSDGFWLESTVSYHDQVWGLVDGALTMIEENYADPDGFVDTRFGLTIGSGTDLESLRYPGLGAAREISTRAKLPNGQILPLNDTWVGPGNLSPYTADSPLVADLLGDIDFTGEGFTALTMGDATEATQIGLEAPRMALGAPYGGGHVHGGVLAMSLFGGGTEVLPYVGYASQPSSNRYLHIDPATRNVPYIWSADTEPTKAGRIYELNRASTLARATGSLAGSQVKLVENSVPGPEGDGVALQRRLVMLVQVAGSRSYALDVTRLRGGTVHQISLRANEQEDTSLETSLPLVDHSGTVKTYLEGEGRNIGRTAAREQMRAPRTAPGSSDFSFSWRGEDSGTTVHAFMNGVPDDEAIFSTISTNRRTLQQASTKDDFPGWHFQRLTPVDPSRTTVYGSVYETTWEGASPLVESVEWLRPADGNPATIVAKVRTSQFTDYVYVSTDNTRRTVEGQTFAAPVAVTRVSADGTVFGRYAYGESSASRTVVAAASGYDGRPGPASSADSTLVLGDALPGGEAVVGRWLRLTTDAGDGWIAQITQADGATVTVDGWLPFEVEGGTSQRTFFPRQGAVIDGGVTATLDSSGVAQAASVGSTLRRAR